MSENAENIIVNLTNAPIIVGNIGGDGELKYLDSGDAVFNFSIACNDFSYFDREKESWVNRTAWYRVSAFGELAEQFNATGQFVKGARIVLRDVRVNARPWITKDGEPAVSLEIRVTRKNQIVPATKLEIESEYSGGYTLEPDDIPF